MSEVGPTLATHDLYELDRACQLITRAFGHHPYLVGTAQSGTKPYRDVDVRLMLPDEEFDAVFAPPDRKDDERPGAYLHLERWELLSLAIGDYLRRRTGLPIDFQIQRVTEANERHAREKGGTSRNPLGMVAPRVGRAFAGMGDGTPFAQMGYWCAE